MATDDKYDRQIRLWGSHGQRALGESKVCLLGSSPCATETMKNLVLPGIGSFTVVDATTVDLPDLGHNWFLEESDVGKPRAEAVCRHLLEMNPDVQGSALVKDPKQVIAEGVEFFKPFALVIACQQTETVAASLCAICKTLAIPLILVTSIGFIAKLRLYAAEHCVMETKPDNEFGDLRLMDPFSELRRYADSIDFDSADDATHAHIPYVVILIRALDIFKRDHDGKQLPSNREEKETFKSIISKMQRTQQEANFPEALENAYKAWAPYSIPDGIQQVLELKNDNPSKDFWVVARAVQQFVQSSGGKLPLAGSLPDMTASTESFIKLQEIYQSRAAGDVAAINAHVASIQKKENGAGPTVAPDYVKRFCQNAQYCEVFSFRTLEEELRPCSPEDGGVDLSCEVEDEDSLIQWYLALRAADRFREERGCWPGAQCADKDEGAQAADTAALAQFGEKLVQSYKAEGVTLDQKMLEELVRCGGSELHVTSATIGGIAAQEAVKLIACQYTPLNNTLILNGLTGKMQTIEL